MTSPLRHYLGHGLRIRSDREIPHLVPTSTESVVDVALWFDRPMDVPLGRAQWVTRTETATRDPWQCCARTASGYLLRFPGVADFHVRADGAEIHCCSSTFDRADPDLHHLVLDHVMPLVLKLRGEEALHASVVMTGDGACAFIGPSGSGKSTLAAMFLAAGGRAIADDCARVYRDRDRVFVVPAYPGVRLRDDVWDAVPHASDSTLIGRAKRRWVPDGAHASFPFDARPLTRIYRLERGGDPHIEPLPMRAAFMELVASTFRFDALDRAMLTAEFTKWEHMARTVAVRRLWTGDVIGDARVRELVGRDLAHG